MPPAHLTSERAPTSAVGPRRVWPATALVVLLGWLLLAWDVLAAGINTAPFFGDQPSRARYLESGATLLTALLPVLLLCLLGLVLGSRFGLLLLAVPALFAVVAGVSLLGSDGDPSDPDPTRAVRAGDFVADLTRPNWLASGILLAILVVVWVVRRRREAGTSAT
ncbi:hypothetical protein [Knoellia koreensis]|uniref:Uncharacterized protein n=1 Tax=Knoellia koreensis TaxID=2730921 RepID=A0A849HK00_9MICO|nr:hypothetical protein [Knoellia sp. DB2414S]NNM47622.1 hypothetical protein [Knoellia sp. DB2414S]